MWFLRRNEIRELARQKDEKKEKEDDNEDDVHCTGRMDCNEITSPKRKVLYQQVLSFSPAKASLLMLPLEGTGNDVNLQNRKRIFRRLLEASKIPGTARWPTLGQAQVAALPATSPRLHSPTRYGSSKVRRFAHVKNRCSREDHR